MSNWDLTPFYANREEFKESLKSMMEKAENLSRFKDSFEENINIIMEELEDIWCAAGHSVCYARQKYYLNMKDSQSIADVSDTMAVYSKVSEINAWIVPKMITCDKEDLLSRLTDENLKKFAHFIEVQFDSKDAILSDKEEALIVQIQKAKEDFSKAYGQLTTSDRPKVKVELNGEMHVINSSNYANYLSDLESQEDRKKVFEAYFKFYNDHSTTLAHLYNSIVSINSSIAKIRGYGSALEATLQKSNKIPVDVYKALIKNAKNHLPLLKDFLNYRKEKLGLKEIHTYDRMRKVFSTDKKYAYEEGYDLVLKAAKSASDEYHDLFKHVLQDGWIDVYPDESKASGAFSYGSYSTHPYILHNYTDDLLSVYTLMHEAGHSMHTHLACENQDLFNSMYPIYLAEIASTFAECVLSDYLLTNETNESVRKTLIEESISRVIATYFRQTLFAEYEYEAHKIVESGNTLTVDVLNNLMKKLYLEYYDIDLDTEESKKFVWAYIPHMFNTPYYVYQYSTCLAASFAIYKVYCESKEKGLDMLFNILKKGNSDYPNKILLESGIDLSGDDAYNGIAEYLKTQIEMLKS